MDPKSFQNAKTLMNALLAEIRRQPMSMDEMIKLGRNDAERDMLRLTAQALILSSYIERGAKDKYQDSQRYKR